MAADPEALYTEVLAEEQQKGVTPAVAEARAKAARARAEHGSPHPKEPKWWPGAQPHLEGGDGAGVEEAPEEEAPAEETVEEAPPEAPAEAPAAEAPAAPEPAAAPASAPEPPADPSKAEPVPSGGRAVGQPAAEVETPVAAAAATATEARPSGVTHGTPTGNRLRPEDSVTTDVQLDAQQAVYQRRKLIDEVVATGVPAVAAGQGARSRTSPLMLLLYVLIPLFAIVFLIGSEDSLGGAEEEDHGPTTETPAPDGGGDLSISAAQLQFSTDTLEVPADEEFGLEFVNEDTVEHNVAIYEEQGGSEIFVGDVIGGGETTTYQVDPIPKGEYYFQCDLHPGMNGKVTTQ